MIRQLRRLGWTAQNTIRAALKWTDSQEKRAVDCQSYWNEPGDASTFETNSHWRGSGPFQDDELWLSLGRTHLDMYHQAARSAQVPHAKRIVEWGSGGGMNAWHFAPTCDVYFGVDINAASLDECGRQLRSLDNVCFRPVCVDASRPDIALSEIDGACDLFLSTYVFELLPSSEYGLKIVELAVKLLRPGGIALIQIRYHNNSRERAKAWNYHINATHMTTYRLDEFWQACKTLGLDPIWIHLVPKQPELGEVRYAYFALQRPESARRGTFA